MKLIKPKIESVPSSAGAVPTKREVNADYGILLDRAETIRVKQGALRREAAIIQARLLAETGQDGRQARAMQILDGRAGGETVPDKTRLAAIINEIGDLDAALAILATRIAVESGKASATVVGQIEDRYRKSVLEICLRLAELHSANIQFHSLVDSLNNDNVNWTGCLRPMHALFLENPRAKYGPVGLYLRDAVEHGFFDAADMPSELRL